MRPVYLATICLCASVCIGQETTEKQKTVSIANSPARSATQADAPGACILASSADGLEQQQEDITRNIALLEARVRSVNAALISMNAIKQDLATQNVQIDQLQAAALKDVQNLPNTIDLRHIPPSVTKLTQTYQSFFYSATGTSLGEDNSGDPEVSSILDRYRRTVRAILSQRTSGQMEAVDGASMGSKAELDQVLKNLSAQAFKDDSEQVLKAIVATTEQLNTLQTQINQSYDLARACRTQVIDKRGEETFMNRLAIRYGLPWFCLTAGALFLIPQLIRAAVVLRNPSLAAQLGFSVDKIIELVTILFISLTILILGLASKIDGQVLGTLLGGISGYVLNRISRQEGAQSSSNSRTPNPENSKSPTPDKRVDKETTE